MRDDFEITKFIIQTEERMKLMLARIEELESFNRVLIIPLMFKHRGIVSFLLKLFIKNLSRIIKLFKNLTSPKKSKNHNAPKHMNDFYQRHCVEYPKLKCLKCRNHLHQPYSQLL